MTQNPREVAGDQDGLTSAVNGGLDLVSSRLVMPAERSPNLLNVEILRDGSVSKRRGFRRELTFTNFSNQYPNGMFSFNLLSGFPVVLSTVNGTLMSAFFPSGDYATQAPQPSGSIARTGVFNTAEKVDFTLLREPNLVSRVLMTQRGTCPIQLSVIEGAATFEVDPLTGLQAICIQGKVFNWASAAYTNSPYFVIYTSGVPWVNTRSIRYAAATNKLYISAASCADITGSGIALGNVNLTVVYHTVQFWAEALKFEGTQIVANAVRGTTDPQDRAVAVPAQLLTNISSIGSEVNFPSYPIRVSQNQSWGSTFGWANPPAVPLDYTFTNNGVTLSAAGQPFIRSPFWVVFGGVPATNSTILFSRGFSIPFIGNDPSYPAGSAPQVFEVYGNDSTRAAWRQWTDNTAGLLAVDYSFQRRNDPGYAATNPWKYLTFDGGNMNRVSTTSQFIVSQPYHNTNAGTYFPDNGLNTNQYVEAGGWVTFGISAFSNYRTRSHPGVSALWQGRLVLAGWKEDPLRLAVSGVEDSAVVGLFWNDFETQYSTGQATDAYDLVLPAQNDDYITAVREFQGSLFIFTRDRLFRMVTQDGAPSIRLVSNVGAGNAACVTDMEGTIVFMGSQGVFLIEPTRDEFDYTTREISANIKTAFERHSTDYGWLAYSSQHSYLFCALGDYSENWLAKNPGVTRSIYRYNVPTKLFVLNTQYSAWAQWSDQTGDTFDTCGGCVVRRSDKTTTIAVARALRGDPARQVSQWNDWCLWEWGVSERYCDTYIYPPSAPLLSSFVLPPVAGVQVQLQDGEMEFFLDREGSQQQPTDNTGLFGGFKFCPVRDIHDVEIFATPSGTLPNPVTDVPLVFGQDYYKTNHNSIVFTTDFARNNNVTIYYGKKAPIQPGIQPDGGWRVPWVMFIDDQVADAQVEPYLDYLKLFVPSYSNKLEYGELYPTWYSSPHWYRAGVGYKKRATTYIGYYNNELLGGFYTRFNLNQNPVQFVGNPKNVAQFDFALTFSDENSGYYDNECYQSIDLAWDFSSLDIGGPSTQAKDFSRISLPVIGAGYNFQVWNYNFGIEGFRLVGYEIRTKAKRGRGINNTTD